MAIERDAEQSLPLLANHAALFRAAASVLSDGVGWPPETELMGETGLPLSIGSRRAIAQPMTAALAATIAAIYYQYQGLIETEIDGGEGKTADRETLLAALKEVDFWASHSHDVLPGDKIPSPHCADMTVWEDLLHSLRMTVLPDNDFEMEEGFLDVPPAQGGLLKEHLGIQHDYFVSTPEDPRAERLEEIRRELRMLAW